MAKKVEEKEKNEIVDEFFRQNDPKEIKSMEDMYAAWKNFFGPAFQKLLDAEMETKLGYAKNERTEIENSRNGYYPERTVAIESLNSTYKRINRNRKVFPTDMSLLKVLYLSTLKAEKKWSVRTQNWDICLSQFRIMYEGRI